MSTRSSYAGRNSYLGGEGLKDTGSPGGDSPSRLRDPRLTVPPVPMPGGRREARDSGCDFAPPLRSEMGGYLTVPGSNARREGRRVSQAVGEIEMSRCKSLQPNSAPSELSDLWDHSDPTFRPQTWVVARPSPETRLVESETDAGGAVQPGGLFVRRRLAKGKELQPINDYYEWWMAHGGSPPPYIIAFVNSRSGNQAVASAMKNQLLTLLGTKFKDYGGSEVFVAGSVCELSEVFKNPNHIRQEITKTKRMVSNRSLRFLVCGGDGTVTWVLQEIEACKAESPDLFSVDGSSDPPIGIVPAGTGNDLARSLGWGSRLKDVKDLVDYIQWVLNADVVELDQWAVSLTFRNEQKGLPPGFRKEDDGDSRSVTYNAVFQNYFSVGMDASVTYGVERSRKTALGKCCFTAGCGKLCYVAQSCRAGGMLGPCNPFLSMKDKIKLREPGSSKGKKIDIGRTRQFTLLNINSYGAGRVPFTNEELRKVSPSDGKLEIFKIDGPKHLGLIMALKICPPAVLKRPDAVAFELTDAEDYQMDGESWRAEAGCKVSVHFNRKVMMLRPPTCTRGIWIGRQAPGFWASRPM